MANLSNDDAQLVPRTDIAGRALEFDFPALRIGVAEYDEGPTGCTVFHFPDGAMAAADIRGGSPGTIMTHQLLAGDASIDAICFAGGSLYGLEAATGVAAELFARHEYSTNWRDIGLVAGAIIFDYGPRATAIYPDKALGRAALRSARSGWFPLTARDAAVAGPPRYDAACMRAVRRKLALSQRVFAEALNVSPATVSAWEQGLRVPEGPTRRLLEIAEEYPEVFTAKAQATASG